MNVTSAIHIACLVTGFAAAWLAQSWRYGAEIADISAASYKANSDAHNAMDELSAKIAEKDAALTAFERKKRHELSNLATQLAARNASLRIKAVCLPQTSASTGGSYAGTAELGRTAESAYIGLKDAHIEITGQVNKCRAILREERRNPRGKTEFGL